MGDILTFSMLFTVNKQLWWYFHLFSSVCAGGSVILDFTFYTLRLTLFTHTSCSYLYRAMRRLHKHRAQGVCDSRASIFPIIVSIPHPTTDDAVIAAGEMRRSAQRDRVAVSSLNDLITCCLCGGYYVDATVIAECLHTCTYIRDVYMSLLE